MAVFTPVTDVEASAFLQSHDIGALVKLQGIAQGVENSNFLLETEQDGTRTRYILTLFESRVPHAELPFFIDLMQHYAKVDIPCPAPIANNAGQMLGRLNGRPALIVSFLQGAGVAPEEITPTHCGQLGGLLARMHQATQHSELSRNNTMAMPCWQQLYAKISTRAEALMPGFAKTIGTELAWLAAHWPEGLTQGIIHADAFPDNVFFADNGTLSGIIDFYFACSDALLYEIAITINAWGFDVAGEAQPARIKALCQSYQAQRPLPEEEWVHLPVLCRGAALRFLLTRTLDWVTHDDANLVTPKDPREYWQKWEFHKGVRGLEAYGV